MEIFFESEEHVLDEYDIYEDEGVEEIFDADGISSQEEGFMIGYLGG